MKENLETETDNNPTIHENCYCNEDQGAGYTYSDEYGDCDYCLGIKQQSSEAEEK